MNQPDLATLQASEVFIDFVLQTQTICLLEMFKDLPPELQPIHDNKECKESWLESAPVASLWTLLELTRGQKPRRELARQSLLALGGRRAVKYNGLTMFADEWSESLDEVIHPDDLKDSVKVHAYLACWWLWDNLFCEFATEEWEETPGLSQVERPEFLKLFQLHAPMTLLLLQGEPHMLEREARIPLP